MEIPRFAHADWPDKVKSAADPIRSPLINKTAEVRREIRPMSQNSTVCWTVCKISKSVIDHSLALGPDG